MKKSILLSLMAALMCVTASGTAALAYENYTMNNLSPEKRQAAEVILKETDARISALHENLRAKHLELDTLSRTPGVTQQQLSKLSAEVSALHTQLRKEMDERAQRLHSATGLDGGQGRSYGGGRGMGSGNGKGRGMGPGYGRGGDCYGYGMGYGGGRGMGYGPGSGRRYGGDCPYHN